MRGRMAVDPIFDGPRGAENVWGSVEFVVWIVCFHVKLAGACQPYLSIISSARR